MGVCLLAMLSPVPVLAQDQVPSPPPVEEVAGQSEMPGTDLTVETIAATVNAAPSAPSLLAISAAKQNVRDASITPESLQTLFFTAWQHELLKDAKVGFKTALPMGGATSGGNAVGRDPGIREISLGGIAFSSDSRWTVWLNGVRITPDAIPQAVMDIKVSRHHIDLKWFDGYTNKIYPIRLRPQERFNLDSRIFLPGTGAM